MLHTVKALIPADISIVQILPAADKIVLVAQSKNNTSCCPRCGCASHRIHSRYVRRLSDLPRHGRVVEIRLHARRFRYGNHQCSQQIFHGTAWPNSPALRATNGSAGDKSARHRVCSWRGTWITIIWKVGDAGEWRYTVAYDPHNAFRAVYNSTCGRD